MSGDDKILSYWFEAFCQFYILKGEAIDARLLSSNNIDFLILLDSSEFCFLPGESIIEDFFSKDIMLAILSAKS